MMCSIFLDRVSSALNELSLSDSLFGKTRQKAVTAVKSAGDKGKDQLF